MTIKRAGTVEEQLAYQRRGAQLKAQYQLVIDMEKVSLQGWNNELIEKVKLRQFSIDEAHDRNHKLIEDINRWPQDRSRVVKFVREGKENRALLQFQTERERLC